MRKFLTLLFFIALTGCASTTTERIVDQAVYQLNQVDAPSKWLIHIEPLYPRVAAEKKIEGWVKMSAVVSENGKVTDIKVLDSHPEGVFEKEAMRAFGKWLYKPALLDGKTVKVYREETIEFKI